MPWARTGRGRLDCFLHEPRTKTTGTHADPSMCTVNDCTDGLDIGAKHPFGLVVRVTDVVSGRGLLLAEITPKSHGHTPSRESVVVKSGVMLP